MFSLQMNEVFWLSFVFNISRTCSNCWAHKTFYAPKGKVDWICDQKNFVSGTKLLFKRHPFRQNKCFGFSKSTTNRISILRVFIQRSIGITLPRGEIFKVSQKLTLWLLSEQLDCDISSDWITWAIANVAQCTKLLKQNHYLFCLRNVSKI